MNGMLCLKCKGQVVSIDVDERIADKHINANTVHWEFCERWDGMTITAQFTQGEKTYDVLVDEVTKTTTLPNELVAGDVDISAFGEHPVTKVRITTVPVKKKIDKSGFVGDGETPIPPTPDLYSQLVEKVTKTAIPHIGANGNWWFDDEDSGVNATAELEEVRDEAIAAVRTEGEATLATIPEDYTALSARAVRNTKTKADAIMDVSAKAASHELYIQPESDIRVMLHGSAEGLSANKIHIGSKNLFSAENIFSAAARGFTFTYGQDGTITINGTRSSSGSALIRYSLPMTLPPGRYRMSMHNNQAIHLGSNNDEDTVIFRAQNVNGGYWGNVPCSPINNSFIITSGINTDIALIRIGANIETIENLVMRPQIVWLGSSSDEPPFEPHVATILDLPLLPDGRPLYSDGSVFDTVENDVIIPCDACHTFTADDDWQYSSGGFFYMDMNDVDVAVNEAVGNYQSAMWSNWMWQNNPGSSVAVPNTFNWWMSSGRKRFGCFVGTTDIEVFKSLLRANPLKVFYKTTGYTPKHALRVSRTVRRWGVDDNGAYKLAKAETYVSAPVPAAKPEMLESDSTVIFGTGETEVTYAHDTKHYIDEKFAALAAALIGG